MLLSGVPDAAPCLRVVSVRRAASICSEPGAVDLVQLPTMNCTHLNSSAGVGARSALEPRSQAQTGAFVPQAGTRLLGTRPGTCFLLRGVSLPPVHLIAGARDSACAARRRRGSVQNYTNILSKIYIENIPKLYRHFIENLPELY